MVRAWSYFGPTPRVALDPPEGDDVDGSRERRRVKVLSPEVMTRGIVDLVEERG